jgi:hypothetical protein
MVLSCERVHLCAFSCTGHCELTSHLFLSLVVLYFSRTVLSRSIATHKGHTYPTTSDILFCYMTKSVLAQAWNSSNFIVNESVAQHAYEGISEGF